MARKESLGWPLPSEAREAYVWALLAGWSCPGLCALLKKRLAFGPFPEQVMRCGLGLVLEQVRRRGLIAFTDQRRRGGLAPFLELEEETWDELIRGVWPFPGARREK